MFTLCILCVTAYKIILNQSNLRFIYEHDFCTETHDFTQHAVNILGIYYHGRMFTALQILGLLVMHLASRTHVLFIQKLILIVIR